MGMLINFQDRYTVNDLPVECNIRLNSGELSLLSGENGAGKSSLVQFLKLAKAEFFGPSSVIFLDQKPLSPLNGVSLDQLLISLASRRREQGYFADKYQGLVDTVNAKEIRNLSGGENQLVKIYLALFLGGDIFILDEPAQYLDKDNIKILQEILKDLKKAQKAILVIEHRKDVLGEMIDTHYAIERKDHFYRIEECS